MATGIVSLAAWYCGWKISANLLLYFNIFAFILLLALNIWRLLRYRRAVLADFRNPQTNPGFLTFVAAACVLGSQLNIILKTSLWDEILFFGALTAWIFLIYSFFIVIMLNREKPSVRKYIHGSWLLTVVSTQSLTILGTLIAPRLPIQPQHQYLISLLLFLCGGIFYFVIIVFIIFRMSFLRLKAGEFEPSYWINMGALAISTLAGALLLTHSDNAVFLQKLFPFIAGCTLGFWAFATWWIPVIVILDYWQYVLRRIPLTYNSQNWDIVFPLGMYTVASIEMIKVLDLPSLSGFPAVFSYLAFAVWVLVFAGMIKKLSGSITR